MFIRETEKSQMYWLGGGFLIFLFKLFNVEFDEVAHCTYSNNVEVGTQECRTQFSCRWIQDYMPRSSTGMNFNTELVIREDLNTSSLVGNSVQTFSTLK